MSIELATKECPHCGRVLPLSEFHRDRSRSDGLHSWCKACMRAAVRARQAKRRAEMGEEAWRFHKAKIVDRHRHRTGNAYGKAYGLARSAAITALIENHREEFDRLLLLARRGELEAG